MSRTLFRLNYRDQYLHLSRSLRESCGKWLGYVKQFLYARSSNLHNFNASADTSVSRGIRRVDNTKQNVILRDTVQRAYVVGLGNNPRHLRNERDQSNKYEQSGQSSESIKFASPSATGTTATAPRTTSGRGSSSSRGTASRSSTASGSSSSSGSSIIFNVSANVTAHREYNSVADHLWWQYAEYTAANTEMQGTSPRVWTSNEPRYSKQADAESRDTIERRTGIPAGVTI